MVYNVPANTQFLEDTGNRSAISLKSHKMSPNPAVYKAARWLANALDPGHHTSRQGASESTGMVPRYASRNESLEFAKRTRKNLEYIERSFHAGADVHVVTQLATSLLGLVVFPWERHFAKSVEAVQLDDLVREGWPKWEVTTGSCQTLGQLIRYLRNAVAHGHLKFSSDSRYVNDVAIDLADYKPGAGAPHWYARITAGDLRTFCIRFIDLLENTIG